MAKWEGWQNAAVLIVEDSEQYCRTLSWILTSQMEITDVTCVSDTEQAYRLLSEDPERFNLLFIDYSFPGGQTGVALFERLAAEKLLKDKVAFLISADPSVERNNQARAAGALGLIVKPFDQHQLTAQLKKAELAMLRDEEESF